jgi:pre-mRNA-splicing factor 18
MDFAKLMSSAISSSSAAPASTDPSKKSKYLKRSEVEAQREAAYRAEQAAAESAAEEKATAKRKREEDEAARNADREAKRRHLAEQSRARREAEARKEEELRRKRLGLPPLPDPETLEAEDTGAAVKKEEDIPDDELITKLRDLNEPARLFDESHAARLWRYLELTKPKISYTDTIIPTTLILVEEKDMKIPATTPPPGSDRDYLLRQLASYFTLVLTEWRNSLAARPAEVQESGSGKQAFAAMLESKQNLTPLFRLFESGEMTPEMLDAVVSIVRAAQARLYVDANNRYLELSIGKAAWPIGVVSVGIHERASRSRIGEESKHVAHIMGDEVARRWLQGIKRCITFAQTRWPPDDQMQLMG